MLSSPLEVLRDRIAAHISQEDHPLLVLTSFDEEVPTIARVVDQIDGGSPADIVFLHSDTAGELGAYVDGLATAVSAQVEEVNHARTASNLPGFEPMPPASSGSAPATRLRALVTHIVRWLPDGDNRLVLAFLPDTISDRAGYASAIGALLGADPSVVRRVRLIVRDDVRTPFLREALARAGYRGAIHAFSRVTVGDIADHVALQVGDRAAPPARRMNALLQCAVLDFALGRYEAAMDKYGLLYTYYDAHRVHELKALVVKSVADVLARLERSDAARDKYLQALEIASDACSLMLVLQITSALGDLATRRGAYGEADVSYSLSADAAEKLGLAHARADALSRAASARVEGGDLSRAVAAWTVAANVSRESDYPARLTQVLGSLRDIAKHAGHRDIAASYESERARVATTGRCV